MVVVAIEVPLIFEEPLDVDGEDCQKSSLLPRTEGVRGAYACFMFRHMAGILTFPETMNDGD
jgi:hypothetical protein